MAIDGNKEKVKLGVDVCLLGMKSVIWGEDESG